MITKEVQYLIKMPFFYCSQQLNINRTICRQSICVLFRLRYFSFFILFVESHILFNKKRQKRIKISEKRVKLLSMTLQTNVLSYNFGRLFVKLLELHSKQTSRVRRLTRSVCLRSKCFYFRFSVSLSLFVVLHQSDNDSVKLRQLTWFAISIIDSVSNRQQKKRQKKRTHTHTRLLVCLCVHLDRNGLAGEQWNKMFSMSVGDREKHTHKSRLNLIQRWWVFDSLTTFFLGCQYV